MTHDEIKKIAAIVGGDDTYRHFVHRINKEFGIADQDYNAQVKVLFEMENDQIIGFCVIGKSPAKMAMWNEIFIDEGWVSADYHIQPDAHELMYMYILPEFRAKGFGKRLLARAFSHAQGENATSIYAYVSDRNDYSINFYKSMNASVIANFSNDGIYTAFIRWSV